MILRFPGPLRLLLLANLTWPCLVSSQSLRFLQPSSLQNGKLPTVPAGQTLLIEWNSDFDSTSLELVDDAGNVLSVLAVKLARGVQSFLWTPSTSLNDLSLSKFRIQLQNNADATCAGCALISGPIVASSDGSVMSSSDGTTGATGMASGSGSSSSSSSSGSTGANANGLSSAAPGASSSSSSSSSGLSPAPAPVPGSNPAANSNSGTQQIGAAPPSNQNGSPNNSASSPGETTNNTPTGAKTPNGMGATNTGAPNSKSTALSSTATSATSSTSATTKPGDPTKSTSPTQTPMSAPFGSGSGSNKAIPLGIGLGLGIPLLLALLVLVLILRRKRKNEPLLLERSPRASWDHPGQFREVEMGQHQVPGDEMYQHQDYESVSLMGFAHIVPANSRQTSIEKVSTQRSLEGGMEPVSPAIVSPVEPVELVSPVVVSSTEPPELASPVIVSPIGPLDLGSETESSAYQTAAQSQHSVDMFDGDLPPLPTSPIEDGPQKP